MKRHTKRSCLHKKPTYGKQAGEWLKKCPACGREIPARYWMHKS